MDKTSVCVFGGPKDNVSQGPNCLGIEVEGELNLIDCGIGMTSASRRGGRARGYGPELSLIKYSGKKVANVAFTHFHEDHVAYGPVLENLGLTMDGTSFFGSPVTNKIADRKWFESLKFGCSYNVINYTTAGNRLKPINRHGCFKMGKLVVYPIPNGHTYGSASFIIVLPDGRKVLVMGDICWHDQDLVKGALWPSTWPKELIPDEIWSNDSTNFTGENQTKSYNQNSQELDDFVGQSLKEGKTVVCMAASTGKGQSLAYRFSKAGLQPWIDGAIREHYEIMRTNPWSELDLPLPELGEDSGIQIVQNRFHRHELMRNGEPKIIVTTGMMGDDGPIVEYLEHGLPRPDYAFIRVSWAAPGTNAFKLCKLVEKYPTYSGNENQRRIQIRVRDENRQDKDVVLPVVADVRNFPMSSHGTLGDSLNYIKEIIDARGGKLLDRLIVSHGTYESINKGVIAHRDFAKTVVPAMRGMKIEID